MNRGEGKIVYNEYVIDRDVTENEPETNQDTLKKVIEEWPDNQDDEKKETNAETENEGVIHRDITEN